MIEKYQGFVPIPRDVQTLPIWGNTTDTALWLYCVLHASHQPYRDLQAGQFYASQAQIAKVMGMTRKTVGISLKRLEQKGLLHVETSDTGTVITVCYWSFICNGKGFGDGDLMVLDTTTGEVSRVPQRSRGKPESETDVPASQPETEDNEDPVREEQFNRFWLAYPKRSNKTEARRLFMALKVDPELVIKAIEEARYSPGWVKEGGRFIPNPAKWLDGGWEQFAPAEVLHPLTEEEAFMRERRI